MTGRKQQIEQEELRAATAIMIRALILAAIVALVVSAAPVASAGPNTLKNSMVTGFGVKAAPPKPPQAMGTRSGGEVGSFSLDIGTAERLDMNATGTATGHSAGKAPDFGIYLSLRKAPPKPRGMLDNPASGGF